MAARNLCFETRRHDCDVVLLTKVSYVNQELIDKGYGRF
jgi:hypothetical protein